MVASEYFSEWCEFLRNFRTSADFESNTRMHAILWTLGHIGASKFGLQLLRANRIVPVIVKLANSCPVLSIRGYKFQVF